MTIVPVLRSGPLVSELVGERRRRTCGGVGTGEPGHRSCQQLPSPLQPPWPGTTAAAHEHPSCVIAQHRPSTCSRWLGSTFHPRRTSLNTDSAPLCHVSSAWRPTVTYLVPSTHARLLPDRVCLFPKAPALESGLHTTRQVTWLGPRRWRTAGRMDLRFGEP